VALLWKKSTCVVALGNCPAHFSWKKTFRNGQQLWAFCVLKNNFISGPGQEKKDVSRNFPDIPL